MLSALRSKIKTLTLIRNQFIFLKKLKILIQSPNTLVNQTSRPDKRNKINLVQKGLKGLSSKTFFIFRIKQTKQKQNKRLRLREFHKKTQRFQDIKK